MTQGQMKSIKDNIDRITKGRIVINNIILDKRKEGYSEFNAFQNSNFIKAKES